MKTKRIKKLTTAERQARQALEALGVDTERVYQAAYRARRRGEQLGKSYDKSSPLISWENVLRQTKQIITTTTLTAKDVEQMRVTSSASLNKKSVHKLEMIERVLYNAPSESAEKQSLKKMDALQYVLRRYSTDELEAAVQEYVKAYGDDALDTTLTGYRYEHARKAYAVTQGGQSAWEEALNKADADLATTYANDVQLMSDAWLAVLGIDVDSLLENMENETNLKLARKYGGYKWE